MKTSFLYLLKKATTSTRYFLLVDGLDEFAEDQEQLVNCLDEIVQVSDSIQLCCSSRPESLFERRFMATPSLRLQDLTRDDLLDVCKRRLSDTKAAPLIGDIISKAQGVFLWVHLVVEDLRKASHHDSIEELAQRLDECPSQMKGLFKLMLDRCDSFYVKTKPKPYLMYVYSCYDLSSRSDEQYMVQPSLLDLALSDTQLVQRQHDLHQPLRGLVDETFLDDICSAEQRIVARSAGLIQVSPLDRGDLGELASQPDETQCFWAASRRPVEFIHRTAFDFLSVEQEGQDFLHACDSTAADVALGMVITRIWACLLLNGSDAPNVFPAALTLEWLGHCPPAYTRLLGQFHGYLAGLCPQSGPSSGDFRDFVLQNYGLSLQCVVPEVKIEEYIAFVTAGSYRLLAFAAWKLAAYPAGHQRKRLLCLFLTHQICDNSTHNSRPITSSSAFMDLLLSEPDLGQTCSGISLHMTTDMEPVSTFPTVRNSILELTLAALLKEHFEISDEHVAGAKRHVGYEMIPRLLGNDPALSDVEISFCISHTRMLYPVIEIAKARHMENGAEDPFTGKALLKWKAESLVSWLCGLREPDGIWPKVVSVSPSGTKRWWNVTEADNLVLCRDTLYERSLRYFAETELFALEGNLLNRNVGSLSRLDLKYLRRVGWATEFGVFIGRYTRFREDGEPGGSFRLLYPWQGSTVRDRGE